MGEQWLVVGAGRCGAHLLRAMRSAGIATAGVVVRSHRAAARIAGVLPGVAVSVLDEPLPPAEALLLAVPDDTVEACARRLAASAGPVPRLALHTAGALAAAALGPLRGRGCRLGAFHPLFSFPPVEAPQVTLAGALAVLEGDDEAVEAAARLAAGLAMPAARLDAGAKARYHAAAAMAANLAPALVALARDEMAAAGLPPEVASAGISLVVGKALAAALAGNGWGWLTGPAVRGDAATVSAHLGALAPDAATAYAAVTRALVGRLEAAGHLDRAVALRLLAALTTQPLCASFQSMPRTEDR